MKRLDNPVNHKQKNLQKMLRRVKPDSNHWAIFDQLNKESRDHELTGESFQLEAMGGGDPKSNDGIVFDALTNLDRKDDLTTENRFTLEALVLPAERPVVDVVGGRIAIAQLTSRWSAFGQGKTRKAIENCMDSVGRIQLASGQHLGTGFVVGDGLLMTNRHVAEIFSTGSGCDVQFVPDSAATDFKSEIGSDKTEISLFSKVMMIHPLWDMAIVKLKERSPKEHRKPWTPLPLLTRDPAEFQGKPIAVIGYPGEDKSRPFDPEYNSIQRKVFRDTFSKKRLQPGILGEREEVQFCGRAFETITHDSSTLGGNSGSAILLIPDNPNDGLQVIGLHFAGAYLKNNYAIPIADIAKDKMVADLGLSFTSAGQIDSKYERFWQKTDSMKERKMDESNHLRNNPSSSDAKKVTWTIPLEVTVSLGQVECPVAASPTSNKGNVDSNSQSLLSEGLWGDTTEYPKPKWKWFEGAILAQKKHSSQTDFWRAAQSAALASLLVYEEGSFVEKVGAEDWNLNTQFIEAGNTQCFIASSKKMILISFRGTQNYRHWMGNFDLWPVKADYGKVHRGFYNAFDAVKGKLEKSIKRLGDLPLVLTGHSLGGALATVAAAEWNSMYNINRVLTFGQPAVGRGDFQKFFREHYDKNFFRFVNNSDIVTRVPPNYWHVGSKIYFDADGDAQSVGPQVEAVEGTSPAGMLSMDEYYDLQSELLQHERQFAPQNGEQVSAEGANLGIRDHSLDQYIGKIRKQING